MQDIATAVGLQKASLYHHIRSKQEILAAILDEGLDLLILDLERVIGSKDPPEVKLRRAIHAYLGRLASEADLAGVLLLEYRRLESPLREAHIARRDRFESLWRSLLKDGVEQGAFATEDDAIVSFALLGVQNWLITWYRPDGRLTTAEFADRFTDLFLNGLRPRPRRPPGEWSARAFRRGIGQDLSPSAGPVSGADRVRPPGGRAGIPGADRCRLGLGRIRTTSSIGACAPSSRNSVRPARGSG